MPHLHYSENGVITSCNPTIKHAENKLVSTVSDLYHDAGGDLDAAVVPKFLANVTGTCFGVCDPRASAFDGVSTFHVNFMFHATRTGSRSTALISPLHRND
jgi:hypothetical protein